MARLTVELPDELSERVRSRAAESGHPSVQDYVHRLLRDDIELGDAGAPAAQRFADLEQLERMVRAGVGSGPAVELTDADWERKRADLVRRRTAGSGS